MVSSLVAGSIQLGPTMYMVISHEMDSLLKLIFSNPNGIFTCYSMYLNRQSIKVMDDNLHS